MRGAPRRQSGCREDCCFLGWGSRKACLEPQLLKQAEAAAAESGGRLPCRTWGRPRTQKFQGGSKPREQLTHLPGPTGDQSSLGKEPCPAYQAQDTQSLEKNQREKQEKEQHWIQAGPWRRGTIHGRKGNLNQITSNLRGSVYPTHPPLFSRVTERPQSSGMSLPCAADRCVDALCVSGAQTALCLALGAPLGGEHAPLWVEVGWRGGGGAPGKGAQQGQGGGQCFQQREEHV